MEHPLVGPWETRGASPGNRGEPKVLLHWGRGKPEALALGSKEILRSCCGSLETWGQLSHGSWGARSASPGIVKTGTSLLASREIRGTPPGNVRESPRHSSWDRGGSARHFLSASWDERGTPWDRGKARGNPPGIVGAARGSSLEIAGHRSTFPGVSREARDTSPGILWAARNNFLGIEGAPCELFTIGIHTNPVKTNDLISRAHQPVKMESNISIPFSAHALACKNGINIFNSISARALACKIQIRVQFVCEGFALRMSGLPVKMEFNFSIPILRAPQPEKY